MKRAHSYKRWPATLVYAALMNIGILGSGTMGSALARRLGAHHEVVIGSRRGPARYEDAARKSDMVFLAIPWPHGLEVIQELGNVLQGRILVDVSNPETEDGRQLVLGHTISGAETIARLIPNTHVIKAFSHFYAELLAGGNVRFDGGIPSVLFCGDDAPSKALLRELITRSGFDPVDAGPLHIARYLEPFAMLTVQLVREQGFGPTGMAWRVMRRTEG